jgi:hypothetical protein
MRPVTGSYLRREENNEKVNPCDFLIPAAQSQSRRSEEV